MSSIINNLHIDALLSEIFNRYGYDFREYAKASLTRRIHNFMAKERINDIDELTRKIITEKETFEDLLNNISVTVTEMFRDPNVYELLRTKIIPYLNTYPKIRIWLAGCATGQEAYSIAILFYEAGLYDKTQIYATDINEKSLQFARNGIYSNDDIKKSTANYQKSGGLNSLSDYYHTKYDNSIFSKKLKKNITFIKHNLVQNRSFNMFNLIICRNVLIYFNKDLQSKILELFSDSLIPNGFLCLGTKESIDFIDKDKFFKTIDRKTKIYKKTKIL